jgi:hypothetical protein
MMNLSSRQGERGAAALSLLTVAMMIALAIFAVMAVPLTRASDAKAQSHSAADAAALAGVDFVRDDLRDALTTEGWLGSWELYGDVVGGGAATAQSYAERNDATLVSYDFNWTTLEAHAVVRGRTVDGQVTRSEATAKLALPSCSTGPVDDPPDPPDEDDDSDEDSDDEPPPPPPVKFSCGGIDVELNPSADEPSKLLLPASIIGALFDDSHAKLVS